MAPPGALALGLSLTRELADSHLVSGKAAAGEEIGLSGEQTIHQTSDRRAK